MPVRGCTVSVAVVSPPSPQPSANDPAHVVIDIEVGAHPVRGTVTHPALGGPAPFEGWMHLLVLVEAVLDRSFGE